MPQDELPRHGRCDSRVLLRSNMRSRRTSCVFLPGLVPKRRGQSFANPVQIRSPTHYREVLSLLYAGLRLMSAAGLAPYTLQRQCLTLTWMVRIAAPVRTRPTTRILRQCSALRGIAGPHATFPGY